MQSRLAAKAIANVNDRGSPFRVNAWRLFVLGCLLICFGGLADLAYHVGPVGHALEPLMGAEGIRAHILTLVGMLVALAGVMGRAVSR
jgi:hypothetical protein